MREGFLHFSACSRVIFGGGCRVWCGRRNHSLCRPCRCLHGGVVRCGKVWCGVRWCGMVVWSGVEWYGGVM